jgi:hypothetical protein
MGFAARECPSSDLGIQTAKALPSIFRMLSCRSECNIAIRARKVAIPQQERQPPEI